MSEIESNEQFFNELDELASEYDFKHLSMVLDKIKDLNLAKKSKKFQAAVLRRKGEWLYALSNYEEDKKKRIAVLEDAYNAAKEAHELDSNDFETCKVLCSTSGRLAEECPLKSKMRYGFLFKSHLDKAISIDSNDFETLHMRGRFSYTVANLTMMERLAAKVIGQIPEVSIKEALDDLLKAEELIPGVAENQLFIGKTYFSMNDIPNAKKWLETAANNTTDMAVEQEHVDEAKELLKDRRFK